MVSKFAGAFRDVVHHRERRALELARECEYLLSRKRRRHAICLDQEIQALSPYLQFLEILHRPGVRTDARKTHKKSGLPGWGARR